MELLAIHTLRSHEADTMKKSHLLLWLRSIPAQTWVGRDLYAPMIQLHGKAPTTTDTTSQTPTFPFYMVFSLSYDLIISENYQRTLSNTNSCYVFSESLSDCKISAC